MKDGTDRYINVSLEEKIKQFRDNGYFLRVHKFERNGKTYFYLKAVKKVNGKREEKSIARISPEDVERLKELGLIGNGRKQNRKPYKKNQETPIINTTTSDPFKVNRNLKNFGNGNGGYGGYGHSMTWQPTDIMIHKIYLRFEKPWVSPLFLHSLGKVEYVERSKQHIVRVKIAKKRSLTIQVNRNGTAQVYLEASNNPLTIEEFIGFCKFYLLETFRKITGREVTLSDFKMRTAPELNVDFNGATLEGIRSMTLKDYYDNLIRIYYADPAEKETMPNGGVRVEARAKNWAGQPLADVVNGLSAFTQLPTMINDLQRTLEEVKGSMTSRQIEVGATVEAVANRIANIIWAMFEKHDANLERVLKQSLKDLLNKVEEWVKDYVEQKVSELGNVMTNGNGNSRREFPWDKTINDVPRGLVKFLSELDKAGYIRIMYEKVMYGDKLWQAIRYYKGNIDAFIEDASYEFLDAKADLRKLFKSVIWAVRFYDNKYAGETGVPWSKFLEALEMHYGKSIGEIELELRKCGYYKPQM